MTFVSRLRGSKGEACQGDETNGKRIICRTREQRETMITLYTNLAVLQRRPLLDDDTIAYAFLTFASASITGTEVLGPIYRSYMTACFRIAESALNTLAQVASEFSEGRLRRTINWTELEWKVLTVGNLVKLVENMDDNQAEHHKAVQMVLRDMTGVDTDYTLDITDYLIKKAQTLFWICRKRPIIRVETEPGQKGVTVLDLVPGATDYAWKDAAAEYMSQALLRLAWSLSARHMGDPVTIWGQTVAGTGRRQMEKESHWLSLTEDDMKEVYKWQAAESLLIE